LIDRLTPDDIRELHNFALERYGGLPGEHEPGLIDFMADKPFDGFGDMEYYPGLFLKAAVYMESFAIHQLFCDGNKRTAFMTAKAFLMLNGYTLSVTDDELYEMTIAVANKNIELEILSTWIENKSYPMS
jgi:death-on-curing protein